MNIIRLFGAAVAAFFFALSPAAAQNPGTVTNHAFVLGKGPGQTGFTSLLCGSAQLAVGQTSADPICRTVTGDVTISAAGVTTIGAATVTSAMLRDSVALSVIGRSANTSGVPADIAAASDFQILRRSGTSIGFGSIDLSQSGAVGSSILPLANGGTNANLTASNGGILWSNATQAQILAGTATARQMLQSGASSAPAWSTATWPATTAAGTVLGSSSANVVAATATPVLGTNGGTGGQITLNGATSGSVVMSVPAAAGTTNFRLPASNGTNGQALVTDGAGNLSYATFGGSGTVTSVGTGFGLTGGPVTTTGTISIDTSSVIPTVATVAALKALAPGAYPTVFVRGYANDGDGGQGFFSWNSGATTADNSCTIFQPTAGGTGRWSRYIERYGEVSIAWCGLFPDNTTDVGPGLQNVITNVVPPGGGVVIVPATRTPNNYYNLATTVTGRNNVEMRGVGGVEQNTGGNTGITFHWGGATSGRILDLRDTVGFIVNNITFKVENTYTGIIIDIGSTAVATKVSFYANIRNVSFVANGSFGSSNATCLNADRTIEWIVYRSQFVNCGNAIQGRTDPDTYAIQSTTADIRNNQFYRNKNSLVNGGDGWNVTYNTFEGNHLGQASAYVQSSLKTRSMYFAHNWMGDVAASGGVYFNINSSVQSFTIEHNFMGGEASNTYVMYVGGGASTVLSGLSISNNAVDTMTGLAFIDTGVQVSGGTVHNNAGSSMAACLLGAGAGYTTISRFNNTGFTATCEMQSLAATGYMTHPNGVLEQWGVSTVTSGTPLAITFPKAFPSACWNSVLTIANIGATGNYAFVNTTCSTTGMTLAASGSGGNTVYWRVIGR